MLALLPPWLLGLQPRPWEDSGNLLNTSPAFATCFFPPVHTPPLGPAGRPQLCQVVGETAEKMSSSRSDGLVLIQGLPDLQMASLRP